MQLKSFHSSTNKGKFVSNFNRQEKLYSLDQSDIKFIPEGRLSFKGFWKRAFDLLISALGLLILSPVFSVIGVLIKRDSAGPVYYRGLRMGRHEKPFTMFKFRTMYENPESYNDSPLTANEDPRITPFGRWLRDTKLNELPQLWNVLKGEMSLVGPRPEDVQIAMAWPEDVRREVLSVLPGITSPASIIYRNEEQLLNSSGFLDVYLKKILPDKLRLDQLYVQNLSFLTDLDVIFMTLIVLLPNLRKYKIKERWLYSGPIYLFFRRVFTWFLVDMLVTLVTVSLAGLVWRVSAVINLGIPTFILVAFGLAVMLSVINTLIGLQRVKWSNASPTYMIDIGFSVGVTCLILWIVNRVWLTEPWIPFSMIWLMGLMTFMGLVAVRYQERLFTGLANRWIIFRGGEVAFGEQILVVGAGELGELAIWLLQRSPFANIFGVVGVVDDDARKQDLRIMEYPVLGTTHEIPTIVEKYKIGMIVFAISNLQPTDHERILALCHSTPARTVIIPDLIKVLEKSMQKMPVQD